MAINSWLVFENPATHMQRMQKVLLLHNQIFEVTSNLCIKSAEMLKVAAKFTHNKKLCWVLYNNIVQLLPIKSNCHSSLQKVSCNTEVWHTSYVPFQSYIKSCPSFPFHYISIISWIIISSTYLPTKWTIIT